MGASHPVAKAGIQAGLDAGHQGDGKVDILLRREGAQGQVRGDPQGEMPHIPGQPRTLRIPPNMHSLMKGMGLKGVRKKRAYHSYKGEVGRVAPNVLQRDFTASAPMMKWATDVSQITIGNCKCYLSPILDLFNGEVVSYTISDSPNLKMVIDMLRKAFRRKKNLNGLLLHSDQGWHYQHIHYQHMLKQRGIVQSMSRKGNCLDNSVMENFFGLMKNELLYVNHFDNIDDFKSQLADYIDYYNNKRIKLKLKMSPVQYRTHFCRQIN